MIFRIGVGLHSRNNDNENTFSTHSLTPREIIKSYKPKTCKTQTAETSKAVC